MCPIPVTHTHTQIFGGAEPPAPFAGLPPARPPAIDPTPAPPASPAALQAWWDTFTGRLAALPTASLTDAELLVAVAGVERAGRAPVACAASPVPALHPLAGIVALGQARAIVVHTGARLDATIAAHQALAPAVHPTSSGGGHGLGSRGRSACFPPPDRARSASPIARSRLLARSHGVLREGVVHMRGGLELWAERRLRFPPRAMSPFDDYPTPAPTQSGSGDSSGAAGDGVPLPAAGLVVAGPAAAAAPVAVVAPAAVASAVAAAAVVAAGSRAPSPSPLAPAAAAAASAGGPLARRPLLAGGKRGAVSDIRRSERLRRVSADAPDVVMTDAASC